MRTCDRWHGAKPSRAARGFSWLLYGCSDCGLRTKLLRRDPSPKRKAPAPESVRCRPCGMLR